MDGWPANAVVSGLVATVLLDLWQRVLKLATGIPPTNWAMVGRWFGHMPSGRFVHGAITEAAPIANELALGWLMHYLIGVLYGLVYVGLIAVLMAGTPSLVNGFVFGLVSVVVPWFLMQPALGLGVMGAKAPKPAIPRYTALTAHCLYGLALYAGSALHRGLMG